jgi:hypothetical protein
MIPKKPVLGLDPRVETVFGKDHAPEKFARPPVRRIENNFVKLRGACKRLARSRATMLLIARQSREVGISQREFTA